MRFPRALAAVGLAVALAGPAAAQTKTDLRNKLKDTAPKGEWVYDDLDAGFASARVSGKPMLVVLRCVL